MFHRTLFGPLGLLAMVLTLVAAPLSASVIDYDNLADWEAATGSYSAVTFDEALPSAGWEMYTDEDGYTSPNGEVQFVGLTSPSSHVLIRAGGILKGDGLDVTNYSTIQVHLPADVTSFSVELMALYGYPGSFTVALSSGEEFDLTGFADETPQFFGITSDIPIAEVNFILTSGISNTTQPGIDNFFYGVAAGAGLPLEDPAETPEAATFLLVGTGLLLLCRARRKRVMMPA